MVLQSSTNHSPDGKGQSNLQTLDLTPSTLKTELHPKPKLERAQRPSAFLKPYKLNSRTRTQKN